jgi:hypothetical protein
MSGLMSKIKPTVAPFFPSQIIVFSSFNAAQLGGSERSELPKWLKLKFLLKKLTALSTFAALRLKLACIVVSYYSKVFFTLSVSTLSQYVRTCSEFFLASGPK